MIMKFVNVGYAVDFQLRYLNNINNPIPKAAAKYCSSWVAIYLGDIYVPVKGCG